MTGPVLRGVAAAVALVATACPQPPPEGDGEDLNPGSVRVTLEDFDIRLSRAEADPGNTAFDVINDGPSLHEFILLQTDVPPGLLPTDRRADVDLEDPEVLVVTRVPPLESDETTSVEEPLEPGEYVVICNLPGHYGQGMFASLTVE